MNGVAMPHTFETQPVARKKNAGELSSAGKQVSLRMPQSLNQRLEAVADALGVDVSNLVRMVLSENLAPYERRAEQIRQDRNG
jgi:hypothetical protein